MNEDNIEKAPNVPAFVRFVASTIPMVFDDSMSYYEALANLVHYIQDTVDVVNNNATVTEEYIQLTKDMKEYMDHYFDNLDVQAEINNKLDQMAVDGTLTRLINAYVDDYMNETIIPTVNNQNIRISAVEGRVNALSSFAPIPVTSTSAMTDTTKTYVLTTDGDWYYYDSGTSTWLSGGTYQAAAIGDGTVSFSSLVSEIGNNIYTQSSDVTLLGKYTTGWDTNVATLNFTNPIFIKAGTTITVSNDFVANYKWGIRHVSTNGIALPSGTSGFIKAVNTDTTFTLTEDTVCVIMWQPIDEDWSSTTYTVNRNHYLNDDDISLTFYYPKLETNKLVDLDINYLKSAMFSGALAGTSFIYQPNIRLTLIARPIKSSADIVVNITDNDFDYGIITWDLSNGIDNRVKLTDTGWLNGVQRVIPANTYFTISCKRHDSGNFQNYPNIRNLLSLRSFSTLNETKSYVDAYISGVGTYNYFGENLDLQFKHGYEYSELYSTGHATTGLQGMDIYNSEYICQLYHGGTIELLDYATGNQLSVIQNVNFNHGDTCQFSNTFYDAGDLLPLLYVTSDITPSVVYVVRIRDLNTASIVKSYTLDMGAGYYAGHCYDFANHLMYSFGYKQNEFHTNTGGTNNVIISVYDMNQETLISGTNYSLQLLDRWEVPFIYCIQGQKFLNGKCYLASSYLMAEQHSRIYVYDPITKQMVALFDDMPNAIGLAELEDFAFVKGTNKYEMVVVKDSKYMKLSFD